MLRGVLPTGWLGWSLAVETCSSPPERAYRLTEEELCEGSLDILVWSSAGDTVLLSGILDNTCI